MKSYFVFLSRNKLYTAIEAVGLILSLAFVILVGTYVYQQLAIAYENPYHDRTYFLNSQKYFALGDDDKEPLDTHIPEIEASARIKNSNNVKIEFNDEDINVDGFYVDAEFFDLFPNYEFIAGSKEAFNDINNVVISKRFAYRLAATPKEAVGKRFKFETRWNRDTIELVVGAVMENFEKTLFPYKDVLMNFSIEERYNLNPQRRKFMAWGGTLTLFRTVEGTNSEELAKKVLELCDKNYNSHIPWRTKETFVLRTLPEGYICEEAYIINCASKSMLQMLVVVVIALLVSAIFNYVNLTFALTGKRAKEMATRRLVGAYKGDIFRSSILESVLFTLVCFGAALLVAEAFEPTMNTLIMGELEQERFIPIELGFTPLYIAIYFIGAVLLGSVVGVLPAVNASRFKPIEVIKGSFRFKSKRVFSKMFIIVQSAISIVLISMAILMEVQLSHMINRPNNVTTENIFALEPGGGFSSYKSIQPLIDKISEMPFVKRIGLTTSFPGADLMRTSFIGMEGVPVSIAVDTWDSTYFRMMNPVMVEDLGQPLIGSYWLSESAASNVSSSDTSRNITFEQYLQMVGGRGKVDHKGGVIKDIPLESAASSEFNSNAVKMITRPESFNYTVNLAIETEGESKEYKRAIIETYRELAKERGSRSPEPDKADYIDDLQVVQMRPAILTIRLIELFMLLAVMLSLLGMVAMSTYFSEQKSKEIAVRKVFGGTVISETLNNVRNYMVMVVIAAFIGVPVAVYAAEKYLERFFYRVDNYWWVFALAVILALTISLLSVLWQVLKAAHTNPAVELKKE